MKGVYDDSWIINVYELVVCILYDMGGRIKW
jgi:hypothetical protein